MCCFVGFIILFIYAFFNWVAALVVAPSLPVAYTLCKGIADGINFGSAHIHVYPPHSNTNESDNNPAPPSRYQV